MITDSKFLGLLSPKLEKFKQVRDHLWNFRCPLCGDSRRNRSKARGYVYRKKSDLFYKCHNCGSGLSIGNLIKEIDPTLHKHYIMERYKAGETGKRKTKEPEFKFEPPKFKPKKTTIHLPSIGSLSKEHYARAYYEAREIPNHFMDKIFYAEDFKKWALSVCQVDYSTLMSGEPRLVIPFFDRDNKLIGAQGRALRESKIRYVTIKVHEDIADSLDKAMNELDSQGVALQIEDSFRYKSSQKEQYEASFGTAKEGLVAHPDESYHVKGLAFDLAQTKEMRDDPRVADVLTNVGFVRPRDDEWWHWSIQE